jgi:hypothetical protein
MEGLIFLNHFSLKSLKQIWQSTVNLSFLMAAGSFWVIFAIRLEWTNCQLTRLDWMSLLKCHLTCCPLIHQSEKTVEERKKSQSKITRQTEKDR